MNKLPGKIEAIDDATAEKYRNMSYAEKLVIATEVSRVERERWMRDLHARHPRATKEEFRQIVIDTILAESEEERRIFERCQRRSEERERSKPPSE